MRQSQLSLFTLVLLISFPSVNAVLYTPSLPNIALYFHISNNLAQQTMTYFLFGYTLSQLIYGPLCNRFGRKKALYIGIGLQLLGSFSCILSGMIHTYSLLIIGRILVSIGAGAGLKMTYTLINDCHDAKRASQLIAYLMPALALTFGFGVSVGGLLNSYLGWTSCFYACLGYGMLLLIRIIRIPETGDTTYQQPAKLKRHVIELIKHFQNRPIIRGGCLMGLSSTFMYAFSAIAPFIAMNTFNMNSAQYGVATLFPSLGLLIGPLVSAHLSKSWEFVRLIWLGILIVMIGSSLILLGLWLKWPITVSLFSPMIIISFGLSFIAPNASGYALSHTKDKANGSAVLNFINIGLPTIILLGVTYAPFHLLMLPSVYLMLCSMMAITMAMYAYQSCSDEYNKE